MRQLHKTALLFLVAATAAVFVCAPASAIQITEMIPYMHLYEVDEFTENPIYVTTDSDFARVEWSVNGSSVWTDDGTENGDDPDTSSNYSPSFRGMAGVGWAYIPVKAVAYDGNGGSHSQTITIKVWGSPKAIEISSMTGPSDVLEDDPFTVHLETSGAFEYVKWYVGSALMYTDRIRPSFWKSSFDYSFPEGFGGASENGRPRTIKAVAYAVGGAVSPPKTFTINVHDGKGKRAISGNSYISSVHIDPDTEVCTVDWTHGITYYNDYTDPDDSKAHLYAWAKVFEVEEDGDEREAAAFRSGDKENGINLDDLILRLDRTFQGYVLEHFYKPMPGNFALIPGRKYRFKAHQALEDRRDQPVWTDLLNGGNTFISQTWRFDPDDEFDGEGLEWAAGGNYVYEE